MAEGAERIEKAEVIDYRSTVPSGHNWKGSRNTCWGEGLTAVLLS